MTVTDKEAQEIAEGCLALPLAWVLGWGTGAVRALVAMKGWEWFVSDTFGVRELTFIQAWGLFMLIAFATFQYNQEKSNHKPFYGAAYGTALSLVVSGFAFSSMLILTWFL